MTAQSTRTYAISAGLSCGVGVVAPLLVLAASTQFDALQSFATATALPFAVGALSGAGVFALTAHTMGLGVSEDEPYVSGYQDAHQLDHNTKQRGESLSVEEEDSERFFGKQGAPKGVPVITRAPNAESTQSAWEDIDAWMASDAYVSCDPAKSKDIYEIALEELRRGNTSVHPVTPSGDSVTTATSPDSTSVFMAAYAAARAARATSLVPTTQQACDSDATASISINEDRPVRRIASNNEKDKLFFAVSNGYHDSDLDEPEVTAGPTVDPILADISHAEPTVAMADYSGHEDMWAQALAILNEKSHNEAVEEGKRFNQFHEHVNNLIEEEFDRSLSSTVRNTSHEYLHVIQGGTMSFPRQQREA